MNVGRLRRTTAGVGTLLLMASAIGAQPRGATLTGKVFADTTLNVMSDVEVMLPALSMKTLTDQKGVFRIDNIPPGLHQVRARRIGYASFETTVEFRAGKSAERAIVLPRVAVLDSVRVVGEVNVPLSYLENRRVGLGHFLSRADLAKVEGIRLPSILQQVPGLGIVNGRTNQGWILSKRMVPRFNKPGQNVQGTDYYIPDDYEKPTGMVAGCYARVYLDGLLLNGTTPAEPVDINQFTAKGIEAIEYYSNSSQTPNPYNRLNSTCGVLVIHSRRSP